MKVKKLIKRYKDEYIRLYYNDGRWIFKRIPELEPKYLQAKVKSYWIGRMEQEHGEFKPILCVQLKGDR